MKVAHAVIVPFPVHGHVSPLMEIARRLTSHGFIVTFINSEFNVNKNGIENEKGIRIRAIPDGLPEDNPRSDFRILQERTENTMPSHLRNVILDINENEENPVTCVIADFFASWALDVAEELGIPGKAGFWSGIIAAFALIYHMPDLQDRGLIPRDGIVREEEETRFMDCMPLVSSTKMAWMIGSEADMIFRFRFWERSANRFKTTATYVLCNSFTELEKPILDTFPDHAGICPVGPILSRGPTAAPPRSHEAVMEWLDLQEKGSVVYVSFGSSVRLTTEQETELAAALEESNRPFLWVTRGLEAPLHVTIGMFREWAPQAEVVGHPSVGCFVSHCGWNSLVESIAGGTPLLCLPIVADQFINASYAVNMWKVALYLSSDPSNVAHRSHILVALEELLHARTDGHDGISQRIGRLRDAALDAMQDDGSSSRKFQQFVTAMQESDADVECPDAQLSKLDWSTESTMLNINDGRSAETYTNIPSQL